MKKRIAEIVLSQKFEKFITLLIVINAVTLGLETAPEVMSRFGSAVGSVDKVLLGIFCAEILVKIWIRGRAFFTDRWCLFDFFVVSISLFPASGALSVLRALRVLRTLRLISVSPNLRKVITGLLAAIPGLGAVSVIMALIFYISAVVATNLFAEQFPQWFGNIWSSCYSLFQIMTLESWSMGIVRPVMQHYPYAWAFFIPFILVTTFTMLNLFIAVIVNSMQAETEVAAEERSKQGHDERVALLNEVRELRNEIKLLRAWRSDQGPEASL